MTRFTAYYCALGLTAAFAATAEAQPGRTKGGARNPGVSAEVAAAAATAEAALTGKVALSADDEKAVEATLLQAFRSAPTPELQTLADRLLKAALAANAPAPSAAKPVPATMPAARLAVALRTRLSMHLPPEKVTADPAAAMFPGAVPAGAKRVTKQVNVPTGARGYICNGVGVSAKSAIWHSTGLYAAPGDTVRVTVPADAVGKKLAVRIGCHTDQLWKLDQWKRAPEISRTVPLDAPTTAVANPFGGLVYITVPPDVNLGTVQATVAGAVEAPTFVRGKTTPAEWRAARSSQAPWAEFVGKNLVVAIPTELARKVEDPAEVTEFWDTVLDGCADLTVVPRQRGRAERFVHDVQISAGYMHSGYPIMGPLGEATRLVDVAAVKRGGAWGYFHELGHNHQQVEWTFNGTTEVTCNLYSMYLTETLCPQAPTHASFRPAAIAKSAAKYRANGAKFEDWQKEPFTALIVYKQMRDEFGWDTFKKTFAVYHDLKAGEKPKGDDAERDQWLIRFSKAAGRNVAPAFDFWGIPVSAAAKQAVADLPAWSPTVPASTAGG